MALAGEENVVVTPVESAISVMLLGSIGFQMLLFYLVHWPDRDIKRYAWQVISQTISIFCAVLLFQAFNGIVEEYIIKGGTEFWEVCIDMGQCVFWLTALQVVLAITSGAVNEMIGKGDPDMEKVELNVKSWSVLFAHVAGFSAINGWGALQQMMFSQTPRSALCIVPVGFVGLQAMYYGFDVIREHISQSDDGAVDEFELKWDEETEEAENEVAGISLSFLTVQALRFAIGGSLPNVEGVEGWERETSHGGVQWHHLLGCGLLFGMVGVCILNVDRCFAKLPERVERVINILNEYFTFGMAWCFFYGVKWALSNLRFTEENALLHVVIALSLSAVSFLWIFVLDKVVDYHVFGGGAEGSELADRAIERIITSLAVLVGFSWEQCFDTAVTVIAASAEEKCPPPLSKLGMSILLVAIVFPAWRIFILPIEQELNAETTEDGARRYFLKTAASQHYQLMMSKETEEHALDVAHLKMKQHRRQAHNLAHPSHAVRPGLKHLEVSAKGIIEVEDPLTRSASARRPTGAHQGEITENLLQ